MVLSTVAAVLRVRNEPLPRPVPSTIDPKRRAPASLNSYWSAPFTAFHVNEGSAWTVAPAAGASGCGEREANGAACAVAGGTSGAVGAIEAGWRMFICGEAAPARGAAGATSSPPWCVEDGRVDWAAPPGLHRRES